MIASIEISLYALTKDYDPIVKQFIRTLREQPGVGQIHTNGLSTQVRGEYSDVMQAITQAMKPTMESDNTCSFVMKVLNVDVEPGETADV